MPIRKSNISFIATKIVPVKRSFLKVGHKAGNYATAALLTHTSGACSRHVSVSSCASRRTDFILISACAPCRGVSAAEQRSQASVASAAYRKARTVIQNGDVTVFPVGLELRDSFNVHHERTVDAQKVPGIE